MSTIKNAQISLYCHFNRIIKEPGTSFQSSALSQKHDDVTDFEICEFHTHKKIWISQERNITFSLHKKIH